MRALVLAAGVGSRLRPLTDHLPKPMLPIGGAPIIAYNLAALARAGFDEVVVNLHYLPHVVRAYVGDGHRFGLRVRYSEEQILLGTAGALTPFRRIFAEDTFGVVFGDNIADIDLGAMLDQHRKRGPSVTIALWEREDVSQSGVAELSPDGRVKRFVEKPAPGMITSRWVNAGYLIAEPRFLDFVPDETPSDLGRDVIPALLAAGVQVDAFFVRGGLWWFDRMEDYEGALSDPRLGAFTASLRLDRAERSAEA